MLIGNFRKNFIFVNIVKRHICDVQNSQPSHDLPISVNHKVILQFHEGLFSRNFAHAKFRENKTLEKNSRVYSNLAAIPVAKVCMVQNYNQFY